MNTIKLATSSCPTLQRLRKLFALLLTISLVALSQAPKGIRTISAANQLTVAFQVSDAIPLGGTFQVINNSPGDQFDPQVDCDLVSYTSADTELGKLEARYFDFVTNTDQAIPGNGSDSLTTVSGGRIAFTEGTLSGSQVVVFDTATQSRSALPGVGLRRPAIGGDVVVYEKRLKADRPQESDIAVYDFNLQFDVRLTFDGLLNRSPSVSATGNAWVWEKCQPDGTGCDIYSTIRTAPGIFVSYWLTGAGEDRNPDTNGQIAVYTSNKNGDNDVYFQPIEGGDETQLAMPGNQRSPHISNNLISFESEVPSAGGTEYDVFIYDINSRNLYRATNTTVNENLSDLSVCNGVGRLVFGAPAADNDLHALTFQLPSATTNKIVDLIALVRSFNLPSGTTNSLISKLQYALAASSAGDQATACDNLTSFINEVQAQKGKKLSPGQATQLITASYQIKTELGCP